MLRGIQHSNICVSFWIPCQRWGVNRLHKSPALEILEVQQNKTLEGTRGRAYSPPVPIQSTAPFMLSTQELDPKDLMAFIYAIIKNSITEFLFTYVLVCHYIFKKIFQGLYLRVSTRKIYFASVTISKRISCMNKYKLHSFIVWFTKNPLNRCQIDL